jgi:hypothetical protein
MSKTKFSHATVNSDGLMHKSPNGMHRLAGPTPVNSFEDIHYLVARVPGNEEQQFINNDYDGDDDEDDAMIVEEEEEDEEQEQKTKYDQTVSPHLSHLLSKTSIEEMKRMTMREEAVQQKIILMKSREKKINNEVSYMYLVATYYEGDPRASTVIGTTKDWDATMRDQRLVGQSFGSSSTTAASSKYNHNHHAHPPHQSSTNFLYGMGNGEDATLPTELKDLFGAPLSQFIDNGVIPMHSSSPPTLPVHSTTTTRASNKKVVRRKIWCLVLAALNKSDEEIKQLEEAWRKGNRGLENRVKRGLEMSQQHNLVYIIAHELLDGELAIKDIGDLFRRQTPIRSKFLLS